MKISGKDLKYICTLNYLKSSNIIKNLTRGIDGLEPDLLFNFNETLLGIELTTLKFVKPPQTPEIILSKIIDKILEKLILAFKKLHL